MFKIQALRESNSKCIGHVPISNAVARLQENPNFLIYWIFSKSFHDFIKLKFKEWAWISINDIEPTSLGVINVENMLQPATPTPPLDYGAITNVSGAGDRHSLIKIQIIFRNE